MYVTFVGTRRDEVKVRRRRRGRWKREGETGERVLPELLAVHQTRKQTHSSQETLQEKNIKNFIFVLF